MEETARDATPTTRMLMGRRALFAAGQPADVEDMEQEITLARLCAARTASDPDSAAREARSAWIASRNRFLKYERQEIDFEVDEARKLIGLPGPDPASQERFEAMIAPLDPDARDVMRLIYREGLGPWIIARRLGILPNWVRPIERDALATLRRTLRPD